MNDLDTYALRDSIGRAQNKPYINFKETEKYWNRIGLTLDDLDELSVIHVAGTDGKV